MLIKRFGRLITEPLIGYSLLKEIDTAKYIAKLDGFISSKKIFVVDSVDWNENWLSEWFCKNHQQLGFSEIHQEDTLEYNELKKKLGFWGKPDFLGLRDGKWLRIEIECFSKEYTYMHGLGYADVLLCYEKNVEVEGIETHELRAILNVENILVKMEIWAYLYLADCEFKNEYDKQIAKSMKKMGASLR